MVNKIFHIPVFVPHKGCPHDCVFCNQRRITGQIKEMTVNDARAVIEAHLGTIEKKYKKEDIYVEIAFFGGSFTAIDIDRQIELLSLADEYIRSQRADALRCSTRPDCINEEILSVAKKYSMTNIELGVQSGDDDVLSLCERGHSFEDVIHASELIKNNGINLGLQMMTGLPGDTREKSIETAKKIIELKPSCVRIYPTLVMEGTRLADMYKDGVYTPQTVEEAASLCAEIVPMFTESGIKILRIGLQTTENVNAETVIGPYHPAFAEIVYSKINRDRIESYVRKRGVHDCELTIPCKKEDVSKTVGHSKCNAEYFKRKYNIDLKVRLLPG